MHLRALPGLLLTSAYVRSTWQLMLSRRGCKECITSSQGYLIVVILRRVPLDWKLSQTLCEVRWHVVHIDEALLSICP